MKSKLGLALAIAYIIVCALFIGSQGLVGESFISIILGLPWSLAFAFFEYNDASGALLFIMLVLPMVINAFILYWIGSRLGRKGSSVENRADRV